VGFVRVVKLSSGLHRKRRKWKKLKWGLLEGNHVCWGGLLWGMKDLILMKLRVGSERNRSRGIEGS